MQATGKKEKDFRGKGPVGLCDRFSMRAVARSAAVNWGVRYPSHSLGVAGFVCDDIVGVRIDVMRESIRVCVVLATGMSFCKWKRVCAFVHEVFE